MTAEERRTPESAQAEDPVTGRVVVFVPDLMDRSKVSAAVPHAVFVRRPDDLVEAARHAEVVAADLSRPGVLDALRAIDAHCFDVRVVAFGSHVDRATLDAARAAGCDQVLARSAFFSRLADVLVADPDDPVDVETSGDD